MDMHIEMSYCCYETFKVLAKNYLDVESHELFATIGRLLGETNMTPVDVAENLMPKSDEENEEARLKALEDARIKAEEEEAGKKIEENGEKVQESDAKLGDGEGKETRKRSDPPSYHQFSAVIFMDSHHALPNLSDPTKALVAMNIHSVQKIDSHNLPHMEITDRRSPYRVRFLSFCG
ncbi:hypothetical protein OSB04_030455 [Centaurea solstitialis]|uniref:AAA+ ATPase At3g28540-like C-terminal domain-containing protein n=1 Tax=Centaurea solstitialis TaxID=347529 RepID=A0AA38VWP9_9ASTR|nr:hypothetical protein OSB04_030455 [Centaurea solstitialis]